MSNGMVVAGKPKELIERNADSIRNLLPQHINADRFIKSAIMAVYNNPDLQACSPESIMQATYTAAELGLDFIEAKGHAYMVPFGKTAKFMPGWRGKIDLATRNGIVKQIDAHIVYSNDEFTITYGTSPTLTHIPCLAEDRGKIIGAYAIAFFSDGSFTTEFMTFKELEKVRSFSKMKDGPAYKNWMDEMYRKAPIHRIFKRLPINPDKEKEWARLMESENELFDLDEAAEPAPALAEPPKRTRKRVVAPAEAPAPQDAQAEPEETTPAQTPATGAATKQAPELVAKLTGVPATNKANDDEWF